MAPRWAGSFAAKHRLSWRYRYARGAVQDCLDALRGASQPGIPPKRLRHFVGDGDFRAIGEEFLGLARDVGGLTSDARVLDIGSGFGRIAMPLTGYLSPRGSYDGIEIMAPAVRWCKRRIARSHPNFRFHHADVRNRLYNPRGRLAEERFEFPFEDGQFDFVLLTSVFTHLLPATVERYMQEIARVLEPGGTVLATAFLLDEASREAIARGASTFDFTHEIASPGIMTGNPAIPEAAIAYPRELFEAMAGSCGLTVSDLRVGRWSGRADGLSVQDLVIMHADGAQPLPDRRATA